MRRVIRATAASLARAARRLTSWAPGARRARRRVSTTGEGSITHMGRPRCSRRLLGGLGRLRGGETKTGSLVIQTPRGNNPLVRIAALEPCAIRVSVGLALLGGHGLFCGRKNRHVTTAATLGGEFDRAGGGGEQGVVAAEADVVTRVEGGAALTHEDVAGQNVLAAELLHAEALGMRVATVARRTTGFLVSHRSAPVLV